MIENHLSEVYIHNKMYDMFNSFKGIDHHINLFIRTSYLILDINLILVFLRIYHLSFISGKMFLFLEICLLLVFKVTRQEQ